MFTANLGCVPFSNIRTCRVSLSSSYFDFVETLSAGRFVSVQFPQVDANSPFDLTIAVESEGITSAVALSNVPGAATLHLAGIQPLDFAGSVSHPPGAVTAKCQLKCVSDPSPIVAAGDCIECNFRGLKIRMCC